MVDALSGLMVDAGSVERWLCLRAMAGVDGLLMLMVDG
jgi:hypothetical protein